MAYDPIPRGTPDWDVPVNAAFTELDGRTTTLEGDVSIIPTLEAKLTGETWYRMVASNDATQNVKVKADYVCDGTDDQTEIQNAVDAAFAEGGGIVKLSSGNFNLSAPITLHPTVTLLGQHGEQIFNPDQSVTSSRLVITAGFVGGAAIVLLGQTAAGYANKSAEQRIYAITILGDDAPAGIHGIQGSDYIHGVVLRDVGIVRVTGKGIYTFTENGSQPFSWTFERVVVDNAGDTGIHLINHTDATMVDVISIGSNVNGFTLSNMPNSRMVGCRAEWSEAHGYKIEGNWGTGQGSGGMLMSGCSTDRNGQNGFDITSTGNAPINIDGTITRRDGRNGGAGGGGYAGISVANATNPIIISNHTNYPGVDDDGSGVNSPDYGLSATGSTYVFLSSGFLHAEVDGFFDGGGNAQLRRGPNVGERTGSTATPTDAFSEPWTAYGNMDVTGYFVTNSGQSNGQWNIFSGAPDALRLGSGGGGLSVSEGGAARMGVATLVGGTATVANTSIAANDRIFLTSQVDGGTPGFLRVSARTVGTNFTITSSSGTDTSTVAWFIVRPA